MSSFFNALYIKGMKGLYSLRDALPPSVVGFGRWMRGWDKERKSPFSLFRARMRECVPDSLRGFWHRRDWWMKIWLKKIFPEKWLYEREYQKKYRKWEKRLWRRLAEANVKLGRPLTDEESERLREYEKRFTHIRLWFMGSGNNIARLCYEIVYFYENLNKGDEHVCNVLFREGELDSGHIAPNKYLSDKFYKSFDLVTRENFPFWYEYLTRNSDKVIMENSESNFRRQYGEMYHFFETGDAPIHNAGLLFSEEEVRQGEMSMRKLGISEPYICIFSRDERYNHEMRKATTAEREEGHLSSLEVDSLSLRNSDINTFKTMTRYFGKQNIQSVRMGAITATKYECEYSVDYANCGRSEFLDVFLFSRALFFVGDASGIYGFALLFGIPWVGINMHTVIFFGDQIQWPEVGIFLKYFDREKRRYLRLREIAKMQLKYHTEIRSNNDDGYDVYFRRHYDIVRNTPEEILDVAKEMYAIKNHSIRYTEHDEELQRRFRESVGEFLGVYPTVVGSFPGRVGMQWLRDNEWFLE